MRSLFAVHPELLAPILQIIHRAIATFLIDQTRLQLVSASLYSLGHGGNDAQKTIGIIWMLLIAAGISGAKDPAPTW